jgi:hypothetical protein
VSVSGAVICVTMEQESPRADIMPVENGGIGGPAFPFWKNHDPT